MKRCLILDCDRPSSRRGLCTLHYRRAIRAILRGSTNWGQIVKTKSVLNARICTVCGNEFSGLYAKSVCSKECRRRRKNAQAITRWRLKHRVLRAFKKCCIICHQPFMAHHRKQLTCQKDCRRILDKHRRNSHAYRLRTKLKKKLSAQTLTDRYVKSKLGTLMFYPPELISLKRAIIKLNREIKTAEQNLC